MPGQSGLAALPLILTKGRNAKIIMLSSNCDEGSAAAIEALAMGASDIMAKPGRSVFGGQFHDLLIERLLKLGTQARWQSDPSDAPPVALRKIEKDRKRDESGKSESVSVALGGRRNI